MTIDALIAEYNDVFSGTPWFGESVLNSLKAIPYQQVNHRPATKDHSIADLCVHMLNWRRFGIEKLKDHAAFDIVLNSTADWEEGVILKNAEDWQALQDALEASQVAIITMLRTKSDQWLEQKAAGKAYTNLYLLRGILQHDIYHLGQIRWINRG